VTSPFVRRRRLAAELRALREQHGMTADELARRIYRSRMTISKLENARGRPNLKDIWKILEVLGITGDRFHEILNIANEAAERGWWDSYGDSMGARQRLFADLESGAVTIRGYNQFSIPGLLQTPKFIKALISLDEANGPLTYRPERMIEARMKRQELALQAHGPTYEIVLDEFVIRRLAVHEAIMSAQLRYLIGTISAEPRLSIRILPVDARIEGGFLARSSFTIYTFPDPDDPPLAVHTEPADVSRYINMYERFREASLSAVASLTLLEEAANRLADLAGSES
jgi:transcriptional regulator with XRE-family HTH domain